VNIDGTTRSCLGLTSCVCIFRRSQGEYVGIFLAFLGMQTSIYVVFMGDIYALMTFKGFGWRVILL